MKYDPNTREQIIALKDGRILFKTHNGFKHWLEDAAGVVITIDESYYNKVKVNRIS